MIGVLVFPDFQLLDAAGPISVFEIAGRLAGAAASIKTPSIKTPSIKALSIKAPSIKVLAATPGPVRSSSGVEMVARGFRPSGAISTLIIAGGEGVRAAARCDKTLAFVRAMARRGVRVASVCSGAYILAEAGLLDGRRATTHWQRTRHFLSAYPKVKLEPDRIFVRDGDIWSSAGISAGIDLALALVAEDFGDEIAQDTARQLVLYHRRSGGQSQFSSLLELKTPRGRFGPLLTWAREHLDAPLTVEDLAERAGMSSRHFTRAFIAETGTTPSKAVERLRIEVARQRVQSSSEAIERVAQATGFRDPERMRRAFIRAFGQPPQSLRRAARAGRFNQSKI
jgi:transcriptional regulator GlxA family with amidase domain